MPRRPHIAALAVAAAPLALGAVAVGAGVGAKAVRDHQAGAAFEFHGRGFGHGVGMSQYGARGRAQAGWSAVRILRHYYRGARLRTVPARTIRVLLSPDAPAVHVWSPGAWRAVGPVGGRTVRVPLARGGAYRLVPAGASGVVLERDGRRVRAFSGPVVVRPAARGGHVAWGTTTPRADSRYRGALRVAPADGGRLRVVNAVSLEDYLKGVVPREMSPSWASGAAAALRAQAVAARSYAIASPSIGADFDVYDDTRSQVYAGVDAEDPRTSRAVDATRRTVLTYGGRVITAYFFSTSGGRTEDVQFAWPGSAPRPYLVSVSDTFDRISPHHVWRNPPRFSAARLGELLRVGAPVASVEVLARGASPRVRSVRVTTEDGRSETMSGATVRARLGLLDTWFSVRRA